jgi:hypothetical protein
VRIGLGDTGSWWKLARDMCAQADVVPGGHVGHASHADNDGQVQDALREFERGLI